MPGWLIIVGRIKDDSPKVGRVHDCAVALLQLPPFIIVFPRLSLSLQKCLKTEGGGMPPLIMIRYETEDISSHAISLPI